MFKMWRQNCKKVCLIDLVWICIILCDSVPIVIGDLSASAKNDVDGEAFRVTSEGLNNKGEIHVLMGQRIRTEFVVEFGRVHNSALCVNIEISTSDVDVFQIKEDEYAIKSLNKNCENRTDDGTTGLMVSRKINLTIAGELIGVGSLTFRANFQNFSIDGNMNGHFNRTFKIDVVVNRELGVIDTLFVVCVYVLEIMEMLVFGTMLDFAIVRHTLKKPIPPLIGLICQYVGMPLVAFAAAKAVAADSLSAVGIFVAGICPGGGTSNIYAYLLDGDLALSITMTTLSTILSLGMMPLWLYTLGKQFYTDYDLDIPYVDILVTLSVIFLPLSIGLLIKNKFPKLARRIESIVTVVVTVLAILLIVTGVYSNLYIFRLFSVRVIIVGCALPYVGFVMGGVLAFLFRQTKSHVKTIAIETGLQNTAIAMILLIHSFPAPLGDLSSVAPIAAEVMSPIPPLLLSIVYLIYKKYCSNKEEEKKRNIMDKADVKLDVSTKEDNNTDPDFNGSKEIHDNIKIELDISKELKDNANADFIISKETKKAE